METGFKPKSFGCLNFSCHSIVFPIQGISKSTKAFDVQKFLPFSKSPFKKLKRHTYECNLCLVFPQ